MLGRGLWFWISWELSNAVLPMRRLAWMCLVCAVLAVSCERSGSGDGPASQPASSTRPEAVDDARSLGQRPLLLSPDSPGLPAMAAGPAILTVAGRSVPIPSPGLTLSPDGTATLVADGVTVSGNVFVLTFTPVNDNSTGGPWVRATCSFRLTSLLSETPDGLYLASADNHLRPLALDIVLTRRPENLSVVSVAIRGKLIPADSQSLVNPQTFDLEAQLEVPLVAP